MQTWLVVGDKTFSVAFVLYYQVYQLQGIFYLISLSLTRSSGATIVLNGGDSVNFTTAEFLNEAGKQCTVKKIEVDTLERTPRLKCVHRSIEKCHFTYITKFSPVKTKTCEENYHKKCRITFAPHSRNETVTKCLTPVSKECNGQGGKIFNSILFQLKPEDLINFSLTLPYLFIVCF